MRNANGTRYVWYSSEHRDKSTQTHTRGVCRSDSRLKLRKNTPSIRKDTIWQEEKQAPREIERKTTSCEWFENSKFVTLIGSLGRFRMTEICSIQLWMFGARVLEMFHMKIVERMNGRVRRGTITDERWKKKKKLKGSLDEQIRSATAYHTCNTMAMCTNGTEFTTYRDCVR